MSLLSNVIKAAPPTPLRKIDRFLADPHGSQKRVLWSLLTKASQTSWGKEYGFHEILRTNDIEAEFKSRVPIHRYPDIVEACTAVRQGKSDVLWPGVVNNFAASSGTTSEGRIIPITDETISHNRNFSVGVGLNYMRRTGISDFLFGKLLMLPGWIENDSVNPESRLGQISGILAENAPLFVKKYQRAIPDRLAVIQDWEEKMAAVTDHVIDQNITMAVFAPSWGQVLFRMVLDRYNKKREKKARYISEIWPNLRLIVTGGVALDSYRGILGNLIGSTEVDMLETYGASEGFMSFQFDRDHRDMTLHLDCGVYHEYVKLEELRTDNPKRYTLSEVEVGVRYAPIISSTSGLWAYELGDVVKFTNLDPYRIRVTGRTVEMLDKYGEAVFGEEAHQALQLTCSATNSRVSNYHVTHTPVDQGQIPAHQWLVEFDQHPEDLELFKSILDDKLRQAGHHYDDRREGMAFDKPQLVSLPDGTFNKWLQRSGKRITAQTKIPRMNEERVVADAVLELLDDLG